MSRLTIEITDQQHQSIKAMAAINGQSIKEYALQRLFSDVPSEDEEKAWDELKLLLSERIKEAEQGLVSSKTFEQIVEEGIRSADVA